MKKAKIMLIAITVLAITGGALAFKANTFNNFDLCTAPNDASGQCQFASISSTAEFKAVAPDFFYKTLDHDPAFDITSCTTRQDCDIPGQDAGAN